MNLRRFYAVNQIEYRRNFIFKRHFPKGATLSEIMEATGWQKHTVRGFRQHPGQQGWRDDRIVEERFWRAHIPNRLSNNGFHLVDRDLRD